MLKSIPMYIIGSVTPCSIGPVSANLSTEPNYMIISKYQRLTNNLNQVVIQMNHEAVGGGTLETILSTHPTFTDQVTGKKSPQAVK